MEEQQRRGAAASTVGVLDQSGCCARADSDVDVRLSTRQHSDVPIECALCGAADFSSVVEVGVGTARLLHWVSPPVGWYLLREARPERGAPLLHGRCPRCMATLLGTSAP